MLTWSFFYSRQSKRSLNKMQIGLIRSASNRAAPPVPSHFALIRLRFANLLRTIWCSMKGGELECTAAFCCCCFEWGNFRRWWGIEFRQRQVAMIAQEEEFSRQWQLLGSFSFSKLISQLSHRHQHRKNWLLFYIIIEPTNKRQFSWICWIAETRVSCLQRSCIIVTMLEKCDNRKMQKFAFSSASRIKDDDHRLMEIEVVLTHLYVI